MALADDPVSHSITITNTNTAISIDGKTYNAYKLFDSTHSGDAYAYYMSTDNQFYSPAILDDYSPTPSSNSLAGILRSYFFVSAIPGDTTKVSVMTRSMFGQRFTYQEARALADKLQPFLADMTPDASGVASGETCTITLPDDEAGQGYYIVTGTAKASDQTADAGKEEITSAVMITNEDPNPVVKPKASIPTLDKKITKVSEGDKEVTGAVLDAQGQAAVAKVGSIVSYKIEVAVPDLTGYLNGGRIQNFKFVISDSISDGLDYVKDSFIITIGGDLTTSQPVFAEDGRSFTFEKKANYFTPYQSSMGNGFLVITYDCIVNEKALETDYENNTAYLTYSRNPYDGTEIDRTPDKKTYVIDIIFDLDKIDGQDNTQHLDGAEFKLYREVLGTTVGPNVPKDKEYYVWDETNKKVTWTKIEGDAEVFVTDTTGHFVDKILGLDMNTTYYLRETKAPAGYNPLSAAIPIVINVSESGDTVTYTATVNGEPETVTNGVIDLMDAQNENQPLVVPQILNNKGAVLPSTGGIGTTIFYVVGSIMVVAAGVLLITKKRMGRE